MTLWSSWIKAGSQAVVQSGNDRLSVDSTTKKQVVSQRTASDKLRLDFSRTQHLFWRMKTSFLLIGVCLLWAALTFSNQPALARELSTADATPQETVLSIFTEDDVAT